MLLFSTAYFLYAAWPSLVNHYVANNDAPQHLIWLFNVQWGEPFYAATSGKIQPWGYGLLCRMLALFFTPYVISSWGPFITLSLVVYYGFRALSPFVPYVLALSGAMLLGHLSYPPMVGFFSRAFCVPLLLIFSCYWLRGNAWGVAASWVLSALFYPAALLIVLGVMGIYLPFVLWGKGAFWGVRLQSSKEPIKEPGYTFTNRNSLLLLMGATTLSVLIVLAKSAELRSDQWIGPFVSQHQLLTQPEYTAGGRVNFVHEMTNTTPAMLSYTLHQHLKWSGSPWVYYGAGVVLLLMVIRRNSRLFPLVFFLLVLVLGAGILHWLAQLLAPLLFIPDRFLSYPGGLMAGLVVVVVLGAIIAVLPRRLPFGILPLLMLAFIYQNRRIYNESLTNYSWLSPIYEKIADLPEGSLVAAPPQVADNLPYFSQRSSFISNESAHALYFDNYHQFIDPRWRDFIRAYTAAPEELELLKTFAQKYRITHLLIDRIFLADNEFYAFEPYQTLFRQRSQGKTPADYLLLNLPPGLGTEITKRYLLVAVAEL